MVDEVSAGSAEVQFLAPYGTHTDLHRPPSFADLSAPPICQRTVLERSSLCVKHTRVYLH